MKKKIFALALAACTLFCLCACTGGEGESNGNPMEENNISGELPNENNNNSGDNSSSDNSSSGNNSSNGNNGNSNDNPSSGNNTNSGNNSSSGDNGNSGGNSSNGNNSSSNGNPSSGNNTNSGNNSSSGNNGNSGGNSSNGNGTSANGILSSFTAEDFSGNTIDSSIFKGFKVTMINVWATYCSPCIQEMPALAALNNEYSDFQVIGIALDTVDRNYNLSHGTFNGAKLIIAQTGANYRHLIPNRSLNSLLSGIQSVPYTIFVNENGEQLGNSYIGSRSKESWKTIILQKLQSAN